jgi:short-subunit dehydrogenase
MMNSQNERIIIFGPSRGLGAAVAEQIHGAETLLIARKISQSKLSEKISGLNHVLDLDLSRKNDQDQAIEASLKFNPHRIFYFIGGGPYGKFAEKNWRDHEWAFEVNFLFPAKMIHALLHSGKKPQIIVTGSAIAESQPDLNAASYSTAKHSLKALMQNLWAEKLDVDLRLFSPGYMDTDMLPKSAWPRDLRKVEDPQKIAQIFLEWALDSQACRHKILE